MTQAEMRNFIRNSAQQPFRVCLADGVSYKVSHPDFAAVSPDSLLLIAGPGHELSAEFIICPLDHIIRVEVLKKKVRAA